MSSMEAFAIVGVGDVDIRDGRPRSSLALNALAAQAALRDAGLDWSDIDGLLCGSSLIEPHYMYSSTLCEYIGLTPRFHASVVLGGATPAAIVAMAANAIRAGECRTCLVTYGDNRGTGGSGRSSVNAVAAARNHPEFERPYGMPPAGAEAMMARRHMYDFGTTREQLAEVAVAMSRHASRNPSALRQRILTVDDVLSSREIADPLRALDCALLTDFGGAAIVTSLEHARDLAQPPVKLLATASVPSHKYVSQARPLSGAPARRELDGMFARAGLSRRDVDVAMIYDGFTISVLLNLESCGFCEVGDAGAYVQEGNLELGSAMPVNPHGGMLSCVHGGVQHVVEAVRQLRGEAGPRQVPGARVAFVHGDGAAQSTHSFLLLTNEC